MTKRIALLFAMKSEAVPLIRELNLVSSTEWTDPNLPFEHFSRTLFTDTQQPVEVLLSLNGKDKRYGVDNIGTEPATLNAYSTLSRFKPNLCVSAGTAGGFKLQGTQIGDVFLSEEASRFHDRRIPIPGWDEYGVGHYPVFSIPGMAKKLGLKQGVVSTANSLDYSEKDWEMMVKNQASIKEMEAAGIAWVASLLKIRFFALKAVTDFVDSHEATEDQFLRNLDLASKALRSKLVTMLDFLHRHPSLW